MRGRPMIITFWYLQTFAVIALSDAAFRSAKCRWNSICSQAGFRLVGHSIVVEHVGSVLACGQSCLAQASCRSANYLKATGECQLNAASSLQYPEQYVPTMTSVYIGAEACTNKLVEPTDDDERCLRGSCSLCSNRHPKSGCSSIGENIVPASLAAVTLSVLPNNGAPRGYVYGSDALVADGDKDTCVLAQNGTFMGWALTFTGEKLVKTVAINADIYHNNYDVYTYPAAGTPASLCAEWIGNPGPDDCNGWIFIDCLSAVATKYIVVQTAMPTNTSTISMCEIAAYE